MIDDEAAAQHEFRIIRHRMAELESRLYRKSSDATPSSPVYIGQVFDGGNMPTTVPGMFATHPVTLDGVEAEGSPGVFDVSTDEVVVLVLGSAVPQPGDMLIARLVDGYWIARKDTAEETEVPPPLCLETPCQTVWPHTLYLTDANGTHELFWNEGIGWICCYEFIAESTVDDFCTSPTSALISVRFGVNCPTVGDGPGDPPCERVTLFMDYDIKDCNFALGAYYLHNTKRCTSNVDQQTVNRDWIAISTSYTRSPVTASWTFPATRLEFGTTFSPLPVSGSITLSE